MLSTENMDQDVFDVLFTSAWSVILLFLAWYAWNHGFAKVCLFVGLC